MISLPHWPSIQIWQQQKKNDLGSVRILLNALDNPHQKLPPIIHIAGTNGKGSVLAMLKSIFETAGYKVHSYTSPHLLEFNERINLAGKNISDYHLFELLETVRMKAEELSQEPSFFEGITIAAFLAFALQPADILLLETGMGGRLDCTNVIEKPILTIITPISFDHMEHLGNSIAEIAQEKAGIIKNNVPCVISAQNDQLYQLFFERCDQLNSPVFCYEYDYVIEETDDSLLYRSQKYSLKLPYPSLQGKHQYLNASTAVASVMMVNDIFQISGEDIAIGIRNAVWPARIEKIDYAKYSHLADKNIQVYLDGAHNAAGAHVLALWIRDYLKKPVYLIIGMTKNRNIEDFCEAFQGLITEGRAVKVLSEPSSYHPDVITNKFQKYHFKFQSSQSLELAIKEICDLNVNEEAAVIITGSLFLASDFYKLLQ